MTYLTNILDNSILEWRGEYWPDDAIKACVYTAKGDGQGRITVLAIKLRDGGVVVHLPSYPSSHIHPPWKNLPFRRFWDEDEAWEWLRRDYDKLTFPPLPRDE